MCVYGYEYGYEGFGFWSLETHIFLYLYVYRYKYVAYSWHPLWMSEFLYIEYSREGKMENEGGLGGEFIKVLVAAEAFWCLGCES